MNENNAMPGGTFPVIELPLHGGEVTDIGAPPGGDGWKLLIVYRGRHCPMCTRFLTAIESRLPQLAELDVSLLAVSADSKEQLEEHLSRLEVTFPVAYGLTIEQMQKLDLYLSRPKSEAETDHIFAEPGLYLIDDERRIRIMDVSNSPFARPDLDYILRGLNFLRNNDSPIRGTYV